MASFFDDDDPLAESTTNNIDDDTELPIAGPSRVTTSRTNGRGRGGAQAIRALQQRTSTTNNKSAFNLDDNEDVDDDADLELPPPLAVLNGRVDIHAPTRQAQQSKRHMSIDMDDYSSFLDDGDESRSKGKGRVSADADDELELDVGEKETLLHELMRHWMDERLAPELLQWRGPLVKKIMGYLGTQIDAADTIANLPQHHEMVLIVQTEIERVRYVLRSYLRVRLHKVEKFAQYLVITPAARRKLSKEEWKHAEKYNELVQKHLVTSVLQNLPERLGRLDEPDMIQKPDLDAAVFAQGRRDCPLIRLPDGNTLTIQKGNTHMLRYRSVRRLLKDGDVRLV